MLIVSMRGEKTFDGSWLFEFDTCVVSIIKIKKDVVGSFLMPLATESSHAFHGGFKQKSINVGSARKCALEKYYHW